MRTAIDRNAEQRRTPRGRGEGHTRHPSSTPASSRCGACNRGSAYGSPPMHASALSTRDSARGTPTTAALTSAVSNRYRVRGLNQPFTFTLRVLTTCHMCGVPCRPAA
jgi:hypothetical protein